MSKAKLVLPLAATVSLALAVPAYAVTITVTSGGDDPSTTPCNLRNAITAINFGNAVQFPGCRNSLSGPFGDNDTVVFAPALANSTITLQQGQISNYAPLTIAGSGQTIDAAGASRVLSTIAFLSLSKLTLTGGDTGNAIGAGLYADQAYIRLDNVRVGANRSASSGGGIAIVNGSANITNSTISGNAADGGHGGAGLFTSSANVALAMTSVTDNDTVCASACGGGIAATNNSTLTITGSTVARNSAAASGTTVAAGLLAEESKIVLVNSTIAANDATGSDDVAGALLENQSTAGAAHGLTLTNVTVSSNTASTTNASATALAGGAAIGTAGTGRLALANTILSANAAMIAGSPALTPDLRAVTGSVTINYSLVGTALSAYATSSNVLSDMPGLAPLGNYGGKTQTMALTGVSPAINSGSNVLAVDATAKALTTDQPGQPRYYGPTVDIGAFEYRGDIIFYDGFGR